MARIGCLSLPAGGHVMPMAALAGELSRRGHTAMLVSVPDAAPLSRARGLAFRFFGAERFPAGTAIERDRQLANRMGVNAALHLARDVFRYSGAVLADASAAIRDADLDLLLIDQADFAAHAVAVQLGLPYVTVALCLILNAEEGLPAWSLEPPAGSPRAAARARRWGALARYWGRPLLDGINRFRALANAPPIADLADLWSPLAQVSQQPAAFEFPRTALPGCFHFTGPFTDPGARSPVPFPFSRLDRRPIVYAAFGSMVTYQLAIFRAIAEACVRWHAQLVLSLGGHSSPETLPPLPGDPIVVGMAPQIEILARASVMITHAGLNSTLESLAAGVPMLAIPITTDEPAVAARIAWTGTGLVVPPLECTPARAGAAIGALLTNPGYRLAAQAFERLIAHGHGLARAADVIDEVAATRRPVPAAPSDGHGRGAHERTHPRGGLDRDRRIAATVDGGTGAGAWRRDG